MKKLIKAVKTFIKGKDEGVCNDCLGQGTGCTRCNGQGWFDSDLDDWFDGSGMA